MQIIPIIDFQNGKVVDGLVVLGMVVLGMMVEDMAETGMVEFGSMVYGTMETGMVEVSKEEFGFLVNGISSHVENLNAGRRSRAHRINANTHGPSA